MVLNGHRNHKAYYGRGEGSGRGYVGWGGGVDYDCHHHEDSCIKMGSDESHFNVSLIARDKVTRHCPQTTTFEGKGKPKRIRSEVPKLQYQSNTLPLGQTGSLG